MSKNYVIYHCHSDLSSGVTNIDSINKYYEYINKAKEAGMTAFGFAEHGNIYEWVHKKNEIEKNDMKYIHAQEFYLTETHKEKIRDNYHIILIAKNKKGTEELNYLSSIASDEKHKYYYPRISLDELYDTSDNIIITTACLGGILHSDSLFKSEFIEFLKNNKHRCFLEIQHHNSQEQIDYNRYLYELSKNINVPLIAGTDTHGITDEDMMARKVLQKSKKVHFNNEDEFDMKFKTYDELVNAYEIQNSLPKEVWLKAIDNTNVMASQIEEFELNYDKKYPKLYDDSLKVFKEKILKGVNEKKLYLKPNFQEYKDRINEELETYIHNEAIDFMLLEEDYKRELRNKGVKYGYSRGSVSGSIIAYILDITYVDSIKYNLNFQRFMNKERITLADIDTDWFDEDRGKVAEYLFAKEGLFCSYIVTFNTINLKGAIKDVGRALEMNQDLIQSISNAVTIENGKQVIDERYVEQYPELFKYAKKLIGVIVSVGNHPAGIVVSPHDVNHAFGTFYSGRNKYPISQINMKEIESLNYVKLDVLGLDAVGLIYKTCDLVGIPYLTPENMDFNDMNVWNSIADDTTMIFQFESDFAGDYLRKVLSKDIVAKIKSKNKNLNYIDLMSISNGAIRPAGESYRNQLSCGIYKDNGSEELNEYLASTLGYLVYQEQVMEFLHKFCGFTMGRADIVRRGFAKKTGTEQFIPDIKSGFIKTMNDKYGVCKTKSEEIIVDFLQVIDDASSYLFSKNHSDPYSFIGFACAYLRHYYPLETLSVAFEIYKEDINKSVSIKKYADKIGIKIKGAAFGKSKGEYFPDKKQNVIYKGIGSIKYCNNQIADELYKLSKNNYTNFINLLYDIKEKSSIDNRQLEILIVLNYFKQFGENKKLLKLLELFNTLGSKKQIKKTDLDKLNISEYLIKKYSNKETKALYKEIDNNGLITELSKGIENKPLNIVYQMKKENEYLGYVEYTNDKLNENYYFVKELKLSKYGLPRITIRCIKTGEEIDTRIKNKKLFLSNPFVEYSILYVKEIKECFKKRPDENGNWVAINETEPILERYEVVVDSK